MTLIKQWTSDQKGLMNEHKALCALKLLPHPWIISARKATREEDGRGIDIVCETVDGTMPLQVKSSWNGMKHHRRKYPDIPCIVVRPSYGLAKIQDHILKVLKEKRWTCRKK